MFDPQKLLNDLLGTQVLGAQATVRDKTGKAMQMARDHPLAAGALAAVLLGTGTGRSLTGSAVKIGGMAAIAGLAYKAYQNYQAGQQPTAPLPARARPELLPPPVDTGFHPSQAPQGETEFTLMLVRAMIAAAKADGRIDDAERAKIGDKLSLAGLGGEAERFLMDEIAKPLDIDGLASAAQTEEQRVELYTAARLAIDNDTRAERGFLDMLAGRLDLPEALVDHIESTVLSAKSVPVEIPRTTPANAEPSSVSTRDNPAAPASTGDDPPAGLGRSRW